MTTTDTKTVAGAGGTNEQMVEDAHAHKFKIMDIDAEDIRRGTALEHEMILRQALRRHWKAVVWSVITSMAVVMESYDLQLIGSFYAYPSFQKKYGVELPDGSYSIPASWQVGFGAGQNAGIVLGVFVNGWLVDRFGHKMVMLVALVVLTGLIFIPFFAPNIQVLLAGEILSGLPWGVFNTIAPSYASEVCPTVLRGYRIPFAIQWIWPVPLFFLLLFAPPSPWWLVRKGRLTEAEKSIERLYSNPTETETKQAVALMVHTTQLERDLDIGTTYWDCFRRKTDRRRTEIACVPWGGQVIVGWAIQSYSTYFFTLAGLSPSDSFKMSLGNFSIAFAGTALSWPLQHHFGRRSIYLAGCCFLGLVMLLIGFLSLANQTSGILWAQAVLLTVWFGGYGLTVGPMPFVIAAEIGSTRLRMKTISLARNSYYVAALVNSVVAPYMLNPTEGNLKGKAAFPAAGMTVLLIIWTFFRLPEAKGRTYAELDLLFERGVPTRQFKNYVVDVVDDADAVVKQVD